MTTLEELGLLKMDFLGLRNLTVLEDAAVLVRRSDPGFDVNSLPEDDGATFAMLRAGRTEGVFQLESAGMTGVCTRLGPKSVEDITAIIALYPPRAHDSIPKFLENSGHPEKISYKHPSLEPILSVTYGCIVYQEQVIEIFRRLAGFSLGQADNIRRAMSKKKHAVIDAERRAFIHGDEARGIPGCLATASARASPTASTTRYSTSPATPSTIPRRGLRHRRLPHGVHEMPPPARIHVRPAHQRARLLH